MGSGDVLGGTRLGPYERSGDGDGAGDDQGGAKCKPVQDSHDSGDDGRAKLQAIRELIRNHPALYQQLPRLSWRKLLIFYGNSEDGLTRNGGGGTQAVTSYESLFRGVWSKRGYSVACVNRMWELNQEGVSDPDMLEAIKREGLVG